MPNTTKLRKMLLDEYVISPKKFREADDESIYEIAREFGYSKHIPNSDSDASSGLDLTVSDSYTTQREQALKDAISKINWDDGDNLPSGRYAVGDDGQLQRTGETEPLDRYHGTPLGDPISDFRASPARDDGEGSRKALNELPAVYTTGNEGIAEQYAYGASVNAPTGQADPRLYDLVLVPNEIVEAGDCTDDETVDAASRLGADVLECPDFGEQPETVVLDDRIIHIRNAINLETGDDLPVPPKTRYKKLSEPSALPKSIEYRGAPKQPSYRTSRGRGRVQY